MYAVSSWHEFIGCWLRLVHDVCCRLVRFVAWLHRVFDLYHGHLPTIDRSEFLYRVSTRNGRTQLGTNGRVYGMWHRHLQQSTSHTVSDVPRWYMGQLDRHIRLCGLCTRSILGEWLAMPGVWHRIVHTESRLCQCVPPVRRQYIHIDNGHHRMSRVSSRFGHGRCDGRHHMCSVRAQPIHAHTGYHVSDMSGRFDHVTTHRGHRRSRGCGIDEWIGMVLADASHPSESGRVCLDLVDDEYHVLVRNGLTILVRS